MVRFLREEKGSVAVLIALAMVVLIGFSALAVDVGYLYFRKSQLMSYADAASLAGAVALRDGKGASELSEVVMENLRDNGVVGDDGFLNEADITFIDPAADPGTDPNTVYVMRTKRQVHVNLGKPEGWLLARVMDLVSGPGTFSEAELKVPGRARTIITTHGGGPDLGYFGDPSKEGIKINATKDLISTNDGGNYTIYSAGGLNVIGNWKEEPRADASAKEIYGNGADGYINKQPYVELTAPYGGVEGIFSDNNQTVLDTIEEYEELSWPAEEHEGGVLAEGEDVYEEYDYYWPGGVVFNNSVKINSTVRVKWQGTVYVYGNLTINGGAQVDGDAKIFVTGNATINGGSSSEDWTNVNGILYSKGELKVNGGTTLLQGALWSLEPLLITGNPVIMISNEGKED